MKKQIPIGIVINVEWLLFVAIPQKPQKSRLMEGFLLQAACIYICMHTYIHNIYIYNTIYLYGCLHISLYICVCVWSIVGLRYEEVDVCRCSIYIIQRIV